MEGDIISQMSHVQFALVLSFESSEKTVKVWFDGSFSTKTIERNAVILLKTVLESTAFPERVNTIINQDLESD